MKTNGTTTKKDLGKQVDDAIGAKSLTIPAPSFQIAKFQIRGNAPYVQNAFSQKAREQMKSTQEAGQTAKKGKKRDPKDFQACYEGAQHISTEGWPGIPATSFRNAMISACRVVGFQMTRAKLSVFAIADGIDKNDGSPLVKITKGEPHYCEHSVRNESGVCDIRARAMWDPGWEASLQIRFDSEQFTIEDVSNLLMRAGIQVGIGEGRPDSKRSCGMDWGTFDIINK